MSNEFTNRPNPTADSPLAPSGMLDGDLSILKRFAPDAFMLWVRGVQDAGRIHELYRLLGVKHGAGISNTRALGNLCELVHGKNRRNEYMAAFFEPSNDPS